MSQDSGDLKADPSGYVVLPRRVRLAAVVGLVVSVFGVGGWTVSLQIGMAEAKEAASEAREDVDAVRISVRRIERYMCLDCRESKTIDCADICGVRRFGRAYE